MSTSQQPWSPDELARMEERRIAAAVAEIALESIEVAGGTVCWGGPGSWMNEGRGIGLRGPVSADEVDRAIAFLVDRGVKPRFDVCPYADPMLVQRLGERGLRALEFQTVLYRALHDVPDTSGGEVELVPVGPSERDVFARQVSRWFNATEHTEQRAATDAEVWSMARLLEHPRMEAWLARADGEWVGGCGLETWPTGTEHAGLAALIMTSVAPAFRRRGLQGAMIAHRLARARDLGATTAVIGSDPAIATGRNALRAGFRVAYTKVAIGAP